MLSTRSLAPSMMMLLLVFISHVFGSDQPPWNNPTSKTYFMDEDSPAQNAEPMQNPQPIQNPLVAYHGSFSFIPTPGYNPTPSFHPQQGYDPTEQSFSPRSSYNPTVDYAGSSHFIPTPNLNSLPSQGYYGHLQNYGETQNYIQGQDEQTQDFRQIQDTREGFEHTPHVGGVQSFGDVQRFYEQIRNRGSQVYDQHLQTEYLGSPNARVYPTIYVPEQSSVPLEHNTGSSSSRLGTYDDLGNPTTSNYGTYAGSEHLEPPSGGVEAGGDLFQSLEYDHLESLTAVGHGGPFGSHDSTAYHGLQSDFPTSSNFGDFQFNSNFQESPLNTGFEGFPKESPLNTGFEGFPIESPFNTGFQGFPIESPLSTGFQGFPIESPLITGFEGFPKESPLNTGFEGFPMNSGPGEYPMNIDSGKLPMNMDAPEPSGVGSFAMYSRFEDVTSSDSGEPADLIPETYGFRPSDSRLIEPSVWQQGSGSADPEPSVPSFNDYDRSMSIGDVNKLKLENSSSKQEDFLSCDVCINDLPTNHGAIINPKTFQTDPFQPNIDFLYPTESDLIRLKEGDEIVLYCSGYRNYLTRHLKQPRELSAYCNNGVLKDKKHKPIKKTDLECLAVSRPSIIQVEKSKNECGHGLSHYQSVTPIYTKNKNNFKHLYDLCAHDQTARTFYAKVEMSNLLQGQQKFDMDVDFIQTQHEFFSDNFIRGIYRGKQVESLVQQLKSYNLHHQLTKGKYKLKPGRLVSIYDFVFRIEQFSALLHGNIMPMWSHLEENNWRAVELAVSWFAAYRKNKIVVYAGTYGNLEHKTDSGSTVELYMGKTRIHHGSSGSKSSDYAYYTVQLIPKLFFKMVVDSVTADCLMIVAHNTTYEVTDEDKVCVNVTKDIWWLKNIQNGSQFGIVYACPCGQHEEKVSFYPEFLPQLPVSKEKLLKN